MTKAELYQKACMLPLLPGVYIIRDKTDTIIYIGKAKRLRIRVSQYFREGVPHDNKVSQMIAHAYAFDVIVCQSEFEALVLEASQIKAHTPKYNILLKDDKGYSYIKVTKEPWPRLSFVLQKEEDDAEYIGPYTSSFAARQMAETAMDAFLLPRCNKRFPQEIGKGRPCLNAHIGKCMAVCSGRISCENYNQAVKSAVHLIRYGKKDILKILNERMQEASDRLEFETAALLRDQIAAITKVSAGQKVIVDPDVEMDVVALAGTPDSVCAAVLRFRDGRLTDKREFLFHDTSDIAAVREEFLPRYYLDDEQIPKIIAVDELPPDSDALQQALNEKRGSEVQLQQAVDGFSGFGSLLVHFGQQLVGVYAMNQRYVRNDIFYFVCLQMPDEMPFYVFGQTFVFGSHFLHLTFSEHTLAGTIRFFYRLVGVKFGNSHQPYLFRQFAQYLF